MFDISVDLSALRGITEDMEPNYKLLNEGIVNATEYIRNVWEESVSGKMLPGMVRAVHEPEYAKSLSTGKALHFPELFHGVVIPVGAQDIVDRVEEGYSSFDMKKGLLNGPKSRPLKDGQGRYNTVPFRHYTPGSNSSISVRMQMPVDIHKQAKQLNRSRPGQWGDSLQTNAPPSTSWNGYTHRANNFQGMYRVGTQQHTQYLTFRRVSTSRTKTITRGPRKGQTIHLGSAPNSWIHPGLSANPVIEAVYNYCMPEVEKNIMKIAEEAFGIS